jgi:hypothetical protein
MIMLPNGLPRAQALTEQSERRARRPRWGHDQHAGTTHVIQSR